MKWAGNIASMGEIRNSYKILIRKCDLDINRMIQLDGIFKKQNVKMWTGFN